MGKQKRADKRLHFIAQALNQKITTNANLANEWYISHKGSKLETTAALRQFKEWVG